MPLTWDTPGLTWDSPGAAWDGIVALPKGTTELERVADVTSSPVVEASRRILLKPLTQIANNRAGHCVTSRGVLELTGLTGFTMDDMYGLGMLS